MTQSIIGSEEEFRLLFKFEYLKGSYDSFKKRYEHCYLVYEHVQDEMSVSTRARVFEYLYNFVSDANKDLLHQVGEMQAQFSHLEAYQESVSPVLTGILEEVEEMMSQLEPQMDDFMEAKFRGHKRTFGQAMKSFFSGW